MTEMRRYVFLDGLRGVAALSVGCLHATQISNIFIMPRHGRLAVDFFFLLSGLVVAHAYDGRLTAGLTYWGFAAKRLIRLYPMIALGAALGTAVTLAETYGHEPHWPIPSLFLGFSAFVLFPLGLFFGVEAYPVNNPMWSLFFELFANFTYAASVRQSIERSRMMLVVLICVTAVLVVLVLQMRTVARVGFGSPGLFFAGFVRVAVPFLAGVLINRYGLRLPTFRYADLAGTLVLAGLLFCPWFPNSPLYDLTCICIAFPVLIVGSIGVSGSIIPNHVWSLLGRLSYPFYLLHQPVIRFIRWAGWHGALPGVSDAGEALIGLLASVALTYVVLALFDEPVRNWLAGRLQLAGKPRPAGAGTP